MRAMGALHYPIASLILFHHLVMSAKHIFRQTPAMASNSSLLHSSPFQLSHPPKAHSHSFQRQLHNSHVPSLCPSPSRSPSGKSLHAQRASALSGVIKKCGTKRARRGWHAGAGRARIRPKRRSGCTRFPPTPVRPSTFFSFFCFSFFVSIG